MLDATSKETLQLLTGASIELFERDLLGMESDQGACSRSAVSFPSYDYVVTLDGSQIYVVKRATTSEYSQ